MSAIPEMRAPFGRPVRGPSALGGDPRRFLALTWTLAVNEFKLRFFGSVLGYLWQLMRPLMLFGVLYAVFTQFVRLGNHVRFYPAVLLTGIVIYTFFVEATAGSIASLVDRENLVRKIHFPRLAIPLSVVLTAYFNLALNLIAVFIFMLASGVTPHWTWFELPPLLLLLGVMCAGIGMLLSALYVRFRDVKPIWEVVIQMIFYATPIIYALETLPSGRLQHAVMLNPLAAIIQQVRHAVIDPLAANAAGAVGGGLRLLIPAGIVVAVVTVGYWYFDRQAPRIAEEL